MSLPPPTNHRASRHRLAAIAPSEAALELAGDTNRAGPAIERYLAVFRDALNDHGSTTRYSNTSVGYAWCCAFVYYCCQQGGFRFPPKPLAGDLVVLNSLRGSDKRGILHFRLSVESDHFLAFSNQSFHGIAGFHFGLLTQHVECLLQPSLVIPRLLQMRFKWPLSPARFCPGRPTPDATPADGCASRAN